MSGDRAADLLPEHLVATGVPQNGELLLESLPFCAHTAVTNEPSHWSQVRLYHLTSFVLGSDSNGALERLGERWGRVDTILFPGP